MIAIAEEAKSKESWVAEVLALLGLEWTSQILSAFNPSKVF